VEVPGANLIPIGQFSKMTRLSVKALRLYDENGLLPPAFVDPATGYRYYGLVQTRSAEIIRILRSVDMPLDEIRTVLTADDQTLSLRTLLGHKDRLTERLAAQERMLRYLESIIQHQERIMPYEIEITESTPQTVAAVRVRTNLRQIADDIAAGFAQLMQGLSRFDRTPSGAPLIIYHDMIDKESEGDLEICAPVAKSFEGDAGVYSRQLEGGTVATTLHHGPYEELGQAYQTLTGWIASSGYEIGGPPREIYLNDPQIVAPEELLTRVEWPVCSKTS
jgi:effector-binding domain-containing protein